MVVIQPMNAGVGLDIGSAPSTARDDSIGRGLQSFGRSLERAGSVGAELAQQLADRQMRKMRFDAKLRKQALDSELEAEVFDLNGNMDPSGAGYTQSVAKAVGAKYDTFFKSLPPILKEEFAPELEASMASWSAAAAKTESGQQQGWYQKAVDERIDEAAALVFNNPALLPDAIAEVDAWVSDSGLWTSSAATTKERARITLETQVVERAIRDGDMSILPHLGIETAGGNADAAALIRGLESLSLKAYPDTRTSTGEFDAWRVGYGSDTITLADGTVQTVGQHTAVPPEDAERDLQRRIVEFQRKIIRQVGIDAWGALPDSARAGLTSVAYHYGSLPKSLVGVVKGGDVQAIASAVAGLSANPDRRRREAAAILGGAEPAPEFADLPFEARRQLHDRLAASGRAMIETATTNAPAAIMNTGRYDGTLPTAQQFVAAYGPGEGADRYRTFQANIEVAETAHTMRTMPLKDVMAVVESYRPTSSGTDAALETEQFNQVQAAAAATIKARNDDPAVYTRSAFPEVASAWERVDAAQNPITLPDGSVRPPDPAARAAAYRDALTATMTAQRTLGIDRPVLLPGGMVASAVAAWKDTTAMEDARVAATVSLLQGTDDVEQQAAIWAQLVEAGIPQEAGGAFDALARKDYQAAQRLFRAALFDASDLPGKATESPEKVKEAITAGLLQPGQVGDIFYGLTDGDISNSERAAADAKLITNAVTLRVRAGEPLDQAVQAVGRDLFGDVVPVRGKNVSVLIDNGADTGAVLTGFQQLMPEVRAALEATSAVRSDLPTADSTKAVFAAAESNQRDRVLAEGYFRNAGEGFVYIDPFGGVAVEGPDGNPLTFTLDQVLGAAATAPPPVDPLEEERLWLEQQSATFGAMGGSARP